MRDCSEGTDATAGQLVLVTRGPRKNFSGKTAGTQLDVSSCITGA